MGRSASLRSRLAALLTVAAAVMAVPAPAAAATSPEYFGTNLQTLGAARTDQAIFLQSLSDGQMTVSRWEINWAWLQGGSGPGCSDSFSWSAVDPFVERAARHGIRLTPNFRFSASCAKQYNRDGSIADELPPSSYDDYGRMIAAFATRYGPNGNFWAQNPNVPARPVLSYEIWNEVNLDEYAWNHRADPAAYSALLREVRPRLKAVDPGAVMMGSLAWQTKPQDGDGVHPNYVPDLAAAGGLAQLDAMAFHPYAPDAQSVFDLVVPLRAQLDALGYPDLPIYANEAGEPAYAGSQVGTAPSMPWASDEGRGASLAFAGEALARSDCKVEQFFNYSITGTETSAERLNEGFMGIMFRDTGQPNLSGQAMQRASRRWVGQATHGGLAPGDRLALCSGRVSPAAAMLPIDATFTGDAAGCVVVTARYDGNPLAGAYLRLRTAAGQQLALGRTGPSGTASACVEPFLLAQPFTAQVDIAKAGASGTVSCDVAGLGCATGIAIAPQVGETISSRLAAGLPLPPVPASESAAPRAGNGPAAIAANAACKWSLATKRLSARARPKGLTRIRIRARIDCAGRPAGTAVRFVVATKAKSAKRETRVRSVFLRTGRPTVIELTRRLRRTDSVVLLHAADRGTGIPRIRSTTTVGTAKR